MPPPIRKPFPHENQPPENFRPDGDEAKNHEPGAFESDLERHRNGDDEVYGSHGVDPMSGDGRFRPGGGTRLTRVGERRRH